MKFSATLSRLKKLKNERTIIRGMCVWELVIDTKTLRHLIEHGTINIKRILTGMG